jgi:hypothetical protein
MLSMRDSSSNGSGSEPSLAVAVFTSMEISDISGGECVMAGWSLEAGATALLRLKLIIVIGFKFEARS